jgi:hypothetical protein
VIPSRYVKGVIARREKNRKKFREFFKMECLLLQRKKYTGEQTGSNPC